MPIKKSALRESFESLIIAVALALFARTFVFQAFKIPSGSMENGLLVGDHLIINKMVFAPAATGLDRAVLPGRTIKRGDVIVFKYPVDPARDFIKRVIGLPGEQIELRRKKVYINGKPLDEPYVHYLTPIPGEGEQLDDKRVAYGPVTVPAGQYFMMGDNRDNSEDSRYWGFTPASYVKGQALFIYFSTGSSFGDIQWKRLLNRVH
jgi:signal peptidase I